MAETSGSGTTAAEIGLWSGFQTIASGWLSVFWPALLEGDLVFLLKGSQDAYGCLQGDDPVAEGT